MKGGFTLFPKFNIGKSGELYVKHLLTKSGFKCELNNVYEKRYDYDLLVQIGKKKFTIECKHDIMALKTKNIAIEYHNSRADQPSGIYSTEADIWVHLIPTDKEDILAYAIPVKKLIEYVESHDPHKHIISGGDDNSNLYIYKISDIINEFSRFDNIEDALEMKELFSKLLKKKK